MTLDQMVSGFKPRIPSICKENCNSDSTDAGNRKIPAKIGKNAKTAPRREKTPREETPREEVTPGEELGTGAIALDSGGLGRIDFKEKSNLFFSFSSLIFLHA